MTLRTALQNKYVAAVGNGGGAVDATAVEARDRGSRLRSRLRPRGKYFTSPNDNTGDDAWPFNKNFHLVLDLALGGEWGALYGVDPNIWPRQLLVDHVRVHQK